MYQATLTLDGKNYPIVEHLNNEFVKRRNIKERTEFSHSGDLNGERDSVIVYRWDRDEAIQTALKWRESK
jgi:hypothetical protein